MGCVTLSHVSQVTAYCIIYKLLHFFQYCAALLGYLMFSLCLTFITINFTSWHSQSASDAMSLLKRPIFPVYCISLFECWQAGERASVCVLTGVHTFSVSLLAVRQHPSICQSSKCQRVWQLMHPRAYSAVLPALSMLLASFGGLGATSECLR